MKERSINITALTNCEEIIMKTIWDGVKESAEGITCAEIRNVIESLYGIAYKDTTVYTFLTHLVDKGFVTTHRKGILFFEPAISEEEYLVSKFRQLNQLWFHGNKDKLNEFVVQHDL